MSGLSLSFPLSRPPGLPPTETSAGILITVEKKVCLGSQYQRIQSVVIWFMVGGSWAGHHNGGEESKTDRSQSKL